MNREIKGLTLNHHFYAAEELVSFCLSETRSKTAPAWKLDVYRFILDFFDDSGFILQQTSGTTGSPKNLQLPKQNLIESAKLTSAFFQLNESQTAVLCLPAKYIAGKMMVVRALVAGLNLILVEPTGTPDFSALNEIDFCAMVPMQAANLLKQKTWPNLKTLILGGAETNSELKTQLRHLTAKIYETYGMAETCSHIALKQMNGTAPEEFFTALPGVALSVDERGCLAIEAPFLREKIFTNDCVELISENRFRWLGRVDNVINSGGIKVKPESLEEKISGLTGLRCVVVGLPDSLLGQKIVLVVETGEKINTSEIQKKLAGKIEKKLIPKEIYTIGELPRNASFKIDRKKLKDLIH